MSEEQEGKTPVEEMKENVEALKGAAEVVEEVVVDGGAGPEYSDTEMKAMDKGWNPDKEAVPEGKDWVSAGEFMRNEKYFSEMRRLRREVSNTNKNFDELKQHHKKVEEVTREKLMATLKRQKKEAMEEGNHDDVIEIDEQLLDLKTSKAEVEQPQELNNVFEDWRDINPWYEDNEDMRETADELGDAFAARHNGQQDNVKLFKHVDRRMRALYPDKFDIAPKEQKRKPVAAVEPASAGRAAAPKKAPKFTIKDLNEQQTKVMRNFEKSGAIKPQDYVDELVRIGELG